MFRRKATDPFDPAYTFENLDDLVRNAQRRGLQVMITIWGTPQWANDGALALYDAVAMAVGESGSAGKREGAFVEISADDASALVNSGWLAGP